MRSDEEILAELKRASIGLFVMSGSVYPVEIIQWDGQTAITPEYLRSVSGSPADSEIRETDLVTFFSANGQFQGSEQIRPASRLEGGNLRSHYSLEYLTLAD